MNGSFTPCPHPRPYSGREHTVFILIQYEKKEKRKEKKTEPTLFRTHTGVDPLHKRQRNLLMNCKPIPIRKNNREQNYKQIPWPLKTGGVPDKKRKSYVHAQSKTPMDASPPMSKRTCIADALFHLLTGVTPNLQMYTRGSKQYCFSEKIFIHHIHGHGRTPAFTFTKPITGFTAFMVKQVFLVLLSMEMSDSGTLKTCSIQF